MRLRIPVLVVILIIIGGVLVMVFHKSPNISGVPSRLEVFDMGLEPAKFVYRKEGRFEVVKVRFSNLSDRGYEFDMGDGNRLWLDAGESRDYEYKIWLDGNIIRIPITRTGTGLVQSSLILKLVPLTEEDRKGVN